MGDGSLMRDDLREKGLLPNYSPYAEKERLPEWAPGEIFKRTGAKAVVDWVNVELFAALEDSSPAFACPALLLRDGSIVGLDGQSPVALVGPSYKEYHLLVRHRNHDPIASEKSKFSPGSTVTISDLYIVEKGKLGQKTDTMPSAIRREENSKIPGDEIVKGYGFYDFNMDGLIVRNGPGNEYGCFVKPFRQ